MYISSPYLDKHVTPLVNASDPRIRNLIARIIRAVETDV